MYFSGKISHSVINYLTEKGIGLEEIYELSALSPNQLRDASGWLPAGQVEDFLKQVDSQFQERVEEAPFIESMGHQSHDLRAWGVLDSVLRMMNTSVDIYGQPQRFISYFVSPEPPLMNVTTEECLTSFDIPISHDEYPFVSMYLSAAIESLPTFMGGELAQVNWVGTRIEINWCQQQDSLFDAENNKSHFRPELMQSMVHSMEESERLLERKEAQVRELQNEVQSLRSKLNRVFAFDGDPKLLLNKEEWAASASVAIEQPLTILKHHLMTLGDYMARAQQLVTLISGMNPKNAPVKEAMRRMDWSHIRSEYPVVIQEGIDQIQGMKSSVEKLDLDIPAVECHEENRIQINLNAVVERAIESVKTQIPDRVEIDSMLFLDRPVEVFPDQMRHALVRVISGAADRIKKEGKIRIVTRPRGTRVEIEITDNGRTVRPALLDSGADLGIADSIVKLHQGNMSYVRGIDHGTTCIIDLPLNGEQL